MVRRLCLLIAAAVTVGAWTGASASTAAASRPVCRQAEAIAGLCASGSASGDAVDLEGTRVGATEASGSSSRGPGGAGSSESGEPPRPLTDAEQLALWDSMCVGNGRCADRGPNTLNNVLMPQQPPPAGDDEDAAAPPEARVVTITDVARYVPATARLRSEPDGWAVLGVPANFWTEVGPVTVPGRLLGEQADVRFTPLAYRWDYGDGTGRTTRTAGSTWSALGQEELTATPTSHRYSARATVHASVAVLWSAEYRVGSGPWTAVAGAVTSTSPGARMLVVRERTVLTAG